MTAGTLRVFLGETGRIGDSFLTIISTAKSHSGDCLSLCSSASSKGSLKLLMQLDKERGQNRQILMDN